MGDRLGIPSAVGLFACQQWGKVPPFSPNDLCERFQLQSVIVSFLPLTMKNTFTAFLYTYKSSVLVYPVLYVWLSQQIGWLNVLVLFEGSYVHAYVYVVV